MVVDKLKDLMSERDFNNFKDSFNNHNYNSCRLICDKYCTIYKDNKSNFKQFDELYDEVLDLIENER